MNKEEELAIKIEELGIMMEECMKVIKELAIKMKKMKKMKMTNCTIFPSGNVEFLTIEDLKEMGVDVDNIDVDNLFKIVELDDNDN